MSSSKNRSTTSMKDSTASEMNVMSSERAKKRGERQRREGGPRQDRMAPVPGVAVLREWWEVGRRRCRRG